MGETQYKGDVGLAAAILYFVQERYYVSLPTTESAPYDLIVDNGSELYRVQTKFTSGKAVDLRCIHSNSGGYVVKHYADKAYDWLFVYRADGEKFLIKESLFGQSTIVPRAEHLI